MRAWPGDGVAEWVRRFTTNSPSVWNSWMFFFHSWVLLRRTWGQNGRQVVATYQATFQAGAGSIKQFILGNGVMPTKEYWTTDRFVTATLFTLDKLFHACRLGFKSMCYGTSCTSLWVKNQFLLFFHSCGKLYKYDSSIRGGNPSSAVFNPTFSGFLRSKQNDPVTDTLSFPWKICKNQEKEVIDSLKLHFSLYFCSFLLL